ncbi:MAG: hypothetical protein IV094_18485 [Vitreoscilla sp.]|nr:hypothetical protein [Vitreoscilla sp.]
MAHVTQTRSPLRVIHLHPAAPAKPAVGAACNGCGICCAAEPCPLGVLVSGRLSGPCRALLWDEAASRYRCGMVSAPGSVIPALPAAVSPLVARLARRWISSATGCDASLVTEPG